MRAQAAFEFTVLIAMAMLSLIILIGLGATLTAGEIDEQRREAMLDLGYTIQDELILATTVHEGYQHDLVLPKSIGRFNYEITNNAESFTLTGGGQRHTFKTPALSGTLQKGANTIRYDGSLTIT